MVFCECALTEALLVTLSLIMRNYLCRSVYKEEFRRQAVEMVIHSGMTQAQVACELGYVAKR
jgi:transposase-like protein